MAKFTAAQATAIAAIQQVINAWGDQLDVDDGTTIRDAGILTADCRYNVAGGWRESLDEVATFYAERKQRLAAAGGVPVMRHIISNFRVSFTSETHATIGYLLVFFAATGTQPFTDYCDPLAVADVKMECRLEEDGHWRISLFDSSQIFRRG